MVADWRIRPARRGDGARCKPLWESWLGTVINQSMDAVDGHGPQRGVDYRLWLAETPDHETVGIVLTSPPVAVLLQLYGRDEIAWKRAPLYRSTVKLQGVAVSPSHRGRGLGSDLVRRAVERSESTADWMYGQFDVSRGLGPFYERLGFTVHPRGASLAIPVQEAPKGAVRLPQLPGEQWFVRYFNGSPPPEGPKIEAPDLARRTGNSARAPREANDPVAAQQVPRKRWWHLWRRAQP